MSVLGDLKGGAGCVIAHAASMGTESLAQMGLRLSAVDRAKSLASQTLDS